MPTTWQKAYIELIDFVTSHPEVQIEQNKVVIPALVRPEFYRLFDAVTASFVSSFLKPEMDELEPLSAGYRSLVSNLHDSQIINKLSCPPDVACFLSDPFAYAQSNLFDLLFDCLRGKVSLTSFEQTALQLVRQKLDSIFTDAYQVWVELALISILRPRKLFTMPLRRTKSMDIIGSESGHLASVNIPTPIESQCVTLRHDTKVLLDLPDAIFFSQRLEKYIAIRSNLEPALCIASNRSQNRTWLPALAEPIGGVNIYTDSEVDNILLMMDAQLLCQPDIVLLTRRQYQANMAIEQEADIINRRLRPIQGTYVVTYRLEPRPGAVHTGNVNVLYAGANASYLENIFGNA